MAAVSVLLLARPADADVNRQVAVGIGARSALEESGAWRYTPAVLSLAFDVRANAALSMRAEIAPHYLAIRPGAALVVRNASQRRTLRVAASAGAASAAFQRASRRTSLLAGCSATFQQRLGRGAYDLAVEAELLSVRQARSDLDLGVGASVYLLRTF